MDKGKIEDSAQHIELNQANLSGALSSLDIDPKKFAEENPLGIRLMQLYKDSDINTTFVAFAKEHISRLLDRERTSEIVKNHDLGLKKFFNDMNNSIPRTES